MTLYNLTSFYDTKYSGQQKCVGRAAIYVPTKYLYYVCYKLKRKTVVCQAMTKEVVYTIDKTYLGNIK